MKNSPFYVKMLSYIYVEHLLQNTTINVVDGENIFPDFSSSLEEYNLYFKDYRRIFSIKRDEYFQDFFGDKIFLHFY